MTPPVLATHKSFPMPGTWYRLIHRRWQSAQCSILIVFVAPPYAWRSIWSNDRRLWYGRCDLEHICPMISGQNTQKYPPVSVSLDWSLPLLLFDMVGFLQMCPHGPRQSYTSNCFAVLLTDVPVSGARTIFSPLNTDTPVFATCCSPMRYATRVFLAAACTNRVCEQWLMC